ncbi:hypothetical protein PSTG_18731 [Puccinia striiformis f. sp. tritici PST-78]|uniref:Uncharacterized protein n=1 Tax=Puccinia striiformis f. sp. tritici PST-78 TaxID=1165861 RepID=A0A0L0ULI6_9BASI|nr:hypothetical protein PSTG_18731 [Puccinia striiformis f. sp. tritici PST-78]
MLPQQTELLDERVDAPRETRIIRNLDPTDIGWVGDASTSYSIGILIGRRWAQFQLKEGWNEGPNPKQDIAWLETVAVRLGLIALIELKIRPGKHLSSGPTTPRQRVPWGRGEPRNLT